MPQQLELRLRTFYEQQDCVVLPENPNNEPRYEFGDQQQLMYDVHRERSPSNDHNLTSGLPDSDGTVYNLNSGARLQHSHAYMEFSGVPSNMDRQSSSAYHSPCWQNDPVDVQMQVLNTRPGGGYLLSNTDSVGQRLLSESDWGQVVAMNSVGASTGAWLFQQNNGELFRTNFPQDTSASLLGYNQFDSTTSMAGGSPDCRQHSYFHGPPRPEPDIALSPCGRDTNFEQDADHQSLVRLVNQEIQPPIDHLAQPAVFPYSYQQSPNFSYRMCQNSLHNYSPHVQPRLSELQRNQNLHSNMAMSLAKPIDAATKQFPLCKRVERVLGGAASPRTVTKHPKSDARATKKMGSRRQGPLTKAARDDAASTRHDGGCWPCKILRNKCNAKVGSDMMCGQCEKAVSPWRFGCMRDTLPSLGRYLLAASLLDQHQPEELSKIVSTHIQGWYPESFIPLRVKWAHGSPINVRVQEFLPNGGHFLNHDQYIFENGAYKRMKMASLPIGMTETLLQEWSPEMHRYLDRTLDDPSFQDFPKNCFRGSQNEPHRELIHGISRYYDGSAGERKNILRNSLKLLMITKLASYTLYLDEDNKEMVLQWLMNHPTGSCGKFTSSRFLNQEIKHVVAGDHRTLLNKELHHLQQGLQASKKLKECWGPVLVSMLALAMVTEIMQHLVQCKASSESAEIDLSDIDYKRRIQKRASDEIAGMEYVMQFLRDLFGRKYISQNVEKKKGFKPIFKPSDRAILDAPSQRFAEDLEAIIRKFGDFFVTRKQLGPPQGSDNPCVSRLVAELLLSCKPEATRTEM